ncbi:MAG: hypothetical protein J6M34_03040 [Clostridia bacterium]|nr:hypothetical protein [Clostridia bacterium]
MKKVPVSLIIDDPAPIISVYYEHAGTDKTRDGRPLVPTYSNDLFFRFCDVAEKRGLRGKFSVVPMPGNKGDIVRGLQGVDPADLQAWLDGVKTRLMPAFSVGPEMLTHHKAVDLSTGAALPMNERDWASTQDRATLIPYIEKAFSLLREAGFSTCGVTSPWDFGIEVEEEYEKSISLAAKNICGTDEAWFFLRALRDRPNAKPWVALEEDGRTLVSIPATLRDEFWPTIDTERCDEDFIFERADRLITADGKSGSVLQVLESGGYPILITHWQSLMSNGLGTGIRILDEVSRRINEHLSDRVEWKSFEEILRMVCANKQDYPKPNFS